MTETTIVRTAAEARRLDVLRDRVGVLLAGSESGGAFEIFDITSARGNGPPLHAHPWSEAYLGLEGEVALVLGERHVMLRPGDFAYAAGGTLHGFSTRSDTARFLVVTSGGGASALFGEIDATFAGRPPELGALLAIARRHGLTVPSPAR